MTASQQPLRRDTSRGWVAGVFAGLGARLGVDPLILRVAFVILAIATGGVALLGYLVARLARIPRVRGDWRIALGVGLLTLSCLLAFRQLGIWWSDAIVWPLVAAAFGVALLWERSRSDADEAVPEPSAPEPAAPRTAGTCSWR